MIISNSAQLRGVICSGRFFFFYQGSGFESLDLSAGLYFEDSQFIIIFKFLEMFKGWITLMRLNPLVLNGLTYLLN